MATTLFQKMKKALKSGELDSDVKGDVVMESLEVISGSPHRVGLGFSGILDAAERVLKLVCQTWQPLVRNSKSEDEFDRKFRTLCINACQAERRNRAMSHPFNPYAIPDRWD